MACPSGGVILIRATPARNCPSAPPAGGPSPLRTNPMNPTNLALFMVAALLYPLSAQDRPAFRLEDLRGTTSLLFTPHPDDDAFCCAGALALLAANGNRIHIAIYTNDDKGSADLDMTSERLARIRKAEEEAACRILGIPTQNIQ